MASSRSLFFLCYILLHFVALTIAQQPIVLQNFCIDSNGNFTTNSTYQANLNHLLSCLSNTEIGNGFYMASYGENQDKVNVMVLCRGDINPDSCESCITNATQELTNRCPNQKEAVIWYDECMLRYSSRYFFGNMEFGPYFWMYNIINVTNPNQFNEKLEDLLDDLKAKAASGGSLHKFATGNTTTPNSGTIYALAQCTPDLSEKQCSDCLTNATDLLPKCCDGKQGGRVIAPSCNFRYEISLFYDNPTPNAPTPSPSPPSPTLQSTPLPSEPSPAPHSTPSPSQTSPTPQSSLSPEGFVSPPPATNSATLKGKEYSKSGTFGLVVIPLLLLQYLSSLSG